MSKLESIIRELRNDIRLTKVKGITSILRCKVLKEEKPKKVVLGKIIDRQVKEIFNRYGIESDVLKEIEYNGIRISLVLDGLDRENKEVYELKTTIGKIPESLDKIRKIYLLQIYVYAYFLECYYINLIYINPEDIKVFRITLDDLKELGIRELFNKIIERYLNNEPYYELCSECYFRRNCKEKISIFKNSKGGD